MVGGYDKYCQDCQKKFGFPNLPNWQKENNIGSGKDWEKNAKLEVEKDLINK